MKYFGQDEVLGPEASAADFWLGTKTCLLQNSTFLFIVY